MKPFALALVAAATLPMLTAPGFAASTGKNRGECYNNLITWCNDNSNHPQACANTVMDACDEIHPAAQMPDTDLPLAPGSGGGAKPLKQADPRPDPVPGRVLSLGAAVKG